jgi:hypothetical protein
MIMRVPAGRQDQGSSWTSGRLASLPERPARAVIQLAGCGHATCTATPSGAGRHPRRRALRARRLGDTAAALAARTGTTILHIAFVHWVEDPDQAPFQQIARDALAQPTRGWPVRSRWLGVNCSVIRADYRRRAGMLRARRVS